MNRWDVVLLVIAGYVAVTALVRLMIRRRDQLLDEVRHGVKMSKKHKEANVRGKERLTRRDKAA